MKYCFINHLNYCFMYTATFTIVQPVKGSYFLFSCSISLTRSLHTISVYFDPNFQLKFCYSHLKTSMEKPNRKLTEKQVIKLSNDRKNPPPEDVKLAAVAVSLDIRLRSADMPSVMQERALRLARELMDSSTSRRPNLTIIARSIKKVCMYLLLLF